MISLAALLRLLEQYQVITTERNLFHDFSDWIIERFVLQAQLIKYGCVIAVAEKVEIEHNVSIYTLLAGSTISNIS